jgi:cyclic pyranopterin phosphate synthase
MPGRGRPAHDGGGAPDKARAAGLPDNAPTARLTHVGPRGDVRMVDVGDKAVTTREAVASGEITMSREALRLIRSGKVKKGDPLQTAVLAGIMAAKQTSSLIPLCHPLPLSHASVELAPTSRGYRITARVRTSSQTGVEMEALTAVSVAALTIYDMVKAVDKAMVIGDICLREKRGGKSGEYVRASAAGGDPRGGRGAGRGGRVPRRGDPTRSPE